MPNERSTAAGVAARSMRARSPRVGVRVIGVAGVFVALVVSAYLVGTLGLLSGSQRRLSARLNDPATRLAATVELAGQYVDDIETGHPTIPGIQAEQDCPALWAARASNVIGGVTPDEATALLDAASRRFSAGSWTVAPLTLESGRPTLAAHNRRGVEVSVVEQVGGTVSSIELTVTVACRPAARRPPVGGATTALPTPASSPG